MNDLSFQFFMSRITHIKDIKENEKTKISLVMYEGTDSTCVLRICKGRDLSALCGALMEIKSPNAAIIYDFVYHEGDTYIIEEQLSGFTAEEQMEQEGLFNEKQTARLIIEACKGLECFHNHRPPIVHNDIKPSNIRICDDGNVKIFDFDVSRAYKQEADGNTELFGTERFASPEHYGFGQTSPRSDVYSLGATMHALLTGEPPKKDGRLSYQKSLKKIIAKCTEKNPADRYASASALRRALEKYLNRSRRALLWFLLLLLLCGLLATGSFLWQSGIFDADKGTEESSSETHSSVISAEDDDTKTQNDSSVQQKEEADDESQTSSEVKPVIKKMQTYTSFEGEAVSTAVLNDGTLLYLESLDGEMILHSSSGVEKVLPLTLSDNRCILAYNSFEDKLFVVSVYGEKAFVHSLSENFELSEEPLYSATRSTAFDIKYGFFSDGTLLCNAFRTDLIDTELWCELGRFDGGFSTVIDDSPYDFSSSAVYKCSLESNEAETFDLPLPPLHSSLCFFDGERLYYIANDTSNGKHCIYSFDGEEFDELLCLNDYKFYTRTNIDIACISENTVWFVDNNSRTIKKIEY